ncbi:MAG TPA: glycoside hydrolase family 18 protein [Terriglobales bacterium]|nr:glycoside hydrolase family 18 protein [Terriglobales bacterium]
MNSCTIFRRIIFMVFFLYSCVIMLFMFAALPASAQTESAAPKRLLGYYPEWGKTQTPPYTAAQIPYSKLTHIAHAFVLLSPGADGSLTIPSGMIEPDLISLAHAAGVKVLVSIGGGDGIEGPRFNEMSASASARQAFVTNVHELLTKDGYDGVDIDWEVPNVINREDCTLLMQELRNELPSPWLISMAVPADPRYYGTGFDIPALAPLVDFFNVMTYDYYGTWSGATGLVSPLLQDPADPEQAGSVKTSMDLYQYEYGVPLAQLNIGTPFYGYEWDGVDTNWTSCAACASYSWNYGTYIKQRINSQGWTWGDDPAARAPYLTNQAIPGFITYDGVGSTKQKVAYVKKRGFGGVFMWELSADYDGQTQDLLDAMYEVWK